MVCYFTLFVSLFLFLPLFISKFCWIVDPKGNPVSDLELIPGNVVSLSGVNVKNGEKDTEILSLVGGVSG